MAELSKIELLVLEWVEKEPFIGVKSLTSRDGYGVSSLDIRSAVWSLMDRDIIAWNKDFKLYIKSSEDQIKRFSLKTVETENSNPPAPIAYVDKYGSWVRWGDYYKLKKDNKELRKLLWLNHGCSITTLYGDDGEMQCSSCRMDFKRDSIDLISKRMIK